MLKSTVECIAESDSMNIHSYLESIPPHLPLLQFLFSSLSPSVILDIGACEGEDSIRYKRLFPHARVIAFEPNPNNLTKIHKTLLDFGVSDVEVYPYALSSANGTADLHISSGCPEGASGMGQWDYGNKSSSLLRPSALMTQFHRWLKFNSTVKVPTRQLDSLMFELGVAAIDFIHMDVQGAELMILEGSTQILPLVSCLWLEVGTVAIYEDQPSAKTTQEYLESFGFIRILEVLTEGSGDHFYINPKRLKVARVH
jgi:FkbM family methyltransferase